MSGENLLTQAFGGRRSEALLALEALAAAPNTMFSATSSLVAEVHGKPIGIVIVHPDAAGTAPGRNMARVFIRRRGFIRWLRLLSVAGALQRCAAPLPFNVSYVSILAVDPEYRGRGIGAKLLDAGEAIGHEVGDLAVCLDVELPNEAAQRFYERQGYSPTGDREASNRLQRVGIRGLRRMTKPLEE